MNSETVTFTPYTPPPSARSPYNKASTPNPTFERSPFAQEVWTDTGKKKFNDLHGWQRHFIKRLIDHGNWPLAGKEAGISSAIDEFDTLKQTQMPIQDALRSIGVDTMFLAGHLRECIQAQLYKLDKNNNLVLDVVDLRLRLKAIEFVCKLMGLVDQPKDAVKDASIMEMFESTDEE